MSEEIGARLVVGNLDAENSLARRGRSAPPELPLVVRRLVSAFATLLRAFASKDDDLLTPVPVSPERLAPVPGLPRPRLVSGAEGRAGARQVLAWAETAEVAALRATAPRPPEESARILPRGPLHERIWRLPFADPGVVAEAHHREFCLELARELGCSLPGSRMVASREDLERHLRGVGEGAWVLKAPLSAAGRDRYLQPRGRHLDARARRTLERLFERHGPLLFEPWMERLADYGCVALLTPFEVLRAGFHRLLVDRRGRVTRIELRAASGDVFDLTGPEEKLFGETFDAVASRLRAVGYVGPFGVDCWRYRDARGRLSFHPLGEINARMTFGLVARALLDRIFEPLGIAEAEYVRLVLGRAKKNDSSDRVVPLLLPGPEGGAAWLERRMA